MTKYKIELEGISNLKMDKWVDGVQPKNEEGYKKQAEMKVYRDDKGNVCIPSSAVKASMKLASSEIGRKMEAKKNRQTIQSAVFIEPEMLTLGKKNHDGIAEDIVTRKGTGDKVTRVKTFRPLIRKGWKVNFELNAFGVPKEFMQEALELAGLRFGLLSHRPEYGRFQVNKFVESK
jgi:hypothetical protein